MNTIHATAPTTPSRRSRSRRLVLGILPAAVLAAGLAATNASPAAANSQGGLLGGWNACKTDCITWKAADGYDYKATVQVATSGLTKMEVFVDTDQTWGGAFAMATSPTFKTNHLMTVNGLQPSSNYFYHLRAKDQAGNTYIETGTFLKTKTRKLTVKLKNVQIADDSDSMGAGEMWVHARVQGTNGAAYTATFPNLVQDANWASSANLYSVNKTFVAINPPVTAKLQVQVADEDSCIPPASFVNVDDGCYESGVSNLNLSIPAGKYSSSSGFTSGWGGVDFTMSVEYKLELVN